MEEKQTRKNTMREDPREKRCTAYQKNQNRHCVQKTAAERGKPMRLVRLGKWTSHAGPEGELLTGLKQI